LLVVCAKAPPAQASPSETAAINADSDLPFAIAEFETADGNVILFIGYLPCVKPTCPKRNGDRSPIASLFPELDVRPG
jgi:hypothetical protein